MGKDGFMTPKAIANRIKAKGLGQLRWYCQLCQKQCRDENGFKCHLTSDSHRRQMDVFGMNPGKVVAEYSAQFENAFMDHLKRTHPFSRILARDVYNEFIQDKHHVHMNSTHWLTLTDFVKYLGREGKCKVEETEKGWYITLIHRDPMQDIAEEKRLKRTEAEKEEEERHLAELQAQVERARKYARTDEGPTEATALVKQEDDAPLVLSLAPAAAVGEGNAATVGAGPAAAGPSRPGLPPRPRPAGKATQVTGVFGEDEDEDGSKAGPGPKSAAAAEAAGASKGGSKLDELMRKELEAKARSSRLENWLHTGIVVKVMSKELAEHGYYKQKGVVEKIIDKFIGEISMLGSGDVIRVDQAQLETVIPQPGGVVRMVNGLYRGCKGVLQEINTDKFQALVKLSDGSSKGKVVWAEYEDVCKLAS